MTRQPHVDETTGRGARLLAVLIASLTMTAMACETAPIAPAPMIGAFTGEVTRNGPVYRLPPVQVIASRKALEREDRERQARVRVQRPPSV